MKRDASQPGCSCLAQSRSGSLLGVQVLGVGSSVPDRIVGNEDLAALGYDADWVVQRTGILARRHAAAETATSDMAVEAARRCLDHAAVDPAEVDLVLVGTYTPDLLLPSTASLVQDRLGLRAPAMDVQAACASFVFALVTGAQFIASGCNRRVLVIGADCNSRIVDPADRETYPIFGDGAGAVLLGPGDQRQGLVSYAWGTDGSGAPLLCRPMGGTRLPYSASQPESLHFLRMEGRQVFRWAVRVLAESVGEVLARADHRLEDVRWFVFHQANLRILQTAAAVLRIPLDRLLTNVEQLGNTASASIPLVLDEAVRAGRIRRGEEVVLSGFGAGLTWGTVLLRW